jgi:hypothetical protein
VDSSTLPSERSKRHRSGKVAGALDPTAVDTVTAALTTAGFDADQIEVAAEDIEGLQTPLNRAGLAGFIGRFLLSIGDDLEELERARQELAAGHTVIMVTVAGDDERGHVRDILRDHGGHGIRYFGNWTITSLD